jgi:hypothetical protein
MICSLILSVIAGTPDLDHFILTINHAQTGSPIPGTENSANVVYKFYGSAIARLQFGVWIVHPDQFYTSAGWEATSHAFNHCLGW